MLVTCSSYAPFSVHLHAQPLFHFVPSMCNMYCNFPPCMYNSTTAPTCRLQPMHRKSDVSALCWLDVGTHAYALWRSHYWFIYLSVIYNLYRFGNIWINVCIVLIYSSVAADTYKANLEELRARVSFPVERMDSNLVRKSHAVVVIHIL
jgi:hypothetical protein